jgi:hypothetical protein
VRSETGQRRGRGREKSDRGVERVRYREGRRVCCGEMGERGI